MKLLPSPHYLRPHFYTVGAGLLLVTLLLASWFASQYWLAWRIEQQRLQLTAQSDTVLAGALEKLAQNNSQLKAITRTLANLSSVQQFRLGQTFGYTQEVGATLQGDLDAFHKKFQLLGIWLLDAQGNVLLKSSAARLPKNAIRHMRQDPSLKPAAVWSNLVFDAQHQQTKSYYAQSLASHEQLTLLVGKVLASEQLIETALAGIQTRHNGDRANIELLMSGADGRVLLADNEQWLDHAMPASLLLGSHRPTTAELTLNSALPLVLSAQPLIPQVWLLGEEQAPVLLASQASPIAGVQLHTLSDASDIFYQAGVKNTLAALISVTLAGTCWGALLSGLSLRRRQRHQGLLTEGRQALLHLNSQLSQLADTDVLTQCPNRRAANVYLRKKFTLLQRQQQPFCVLVVEIDDFKKITAQYGDDISDQVLCHLVLNTRTLLDSSDRLARLGTDKFLVIFSHRHYAHARSFIRSLINTLAAHPLLLTDEWREDRQLKMPGGADNTLHFTISGGLAEARHDDDIQQLLVRAEDYLYAAKKQGCGRILGQHSFRREA